MQSILYMPCVASLAQILVLKLCKRPILKAVLLLMPIPSLKLELGKGISEREDFENSIKN